MEIVNKTIPEKNWQEVELTPDEFFNLFKDEEEIDFVNFHFDQSDHYVDEMASIKGGRIYLSSYQHGIVKWSDEKSQYIHMYHMRDYDLGQLQKVSMRKEYYDEIKEQQNEAE